jgi:hypothetical protein
MKVEYYSESNKKSCDKIMYGKTFKTDIIVFIGNDVTMCLKSHWLIIFSISQSVETENIR